MPQFLMDGQEPYDGSGYLIDDIESVEITLCGEPAVKGAGFRMMRSAGGEDGQNKAAMNFYRKLGGSSGSASAVGRSDIAAAGKHKRQVLGYATVPWIEDWYGDVLDPDSVERAAHSFLKNLGTGHTFGNGVGEEHMRFWNNAYVIESSIDRNGSQGIPGGWWVGLQITSPEVWEKVASGEYSGFSLGSEVVYTDTRSERFGRSVYEMMPDLGKLGNGIEPIAGKSGGLAGNREVLEWAGYPSERESYADGKNYKFPINTRSRAYACLRYILRHWKDDKMGGEYSPDELCYMIRRTLGAVAAAGDVIPDAVLEKAGFNDGRDDRMSSVIEFAKTSGIKCTSKTIGREPGDTEKDKELGNRTDDKGGTYFFYSSKGTSSSSTGKTDDKGASASNDNPSAGAGSVGGPATKNCDIHNSKNNQNNCSTKEDDGDMTLDELFVQMKAQSDATNSLLLSIATKLDSISGAGTGTAGDALKNASAGDEKKPEADDKEDKKKTAADDDKKEPTASSEEEDEEKKEDKKTKAGDDKGGEADKKEQAVALLTQALAEVLGRKADNAGTAAGAAKSASAGGGVSADDLQKALAEFGAKVTDTLGASQRSTADILQNIADRIAEMPVPRATMNRSMSRDQKSAFLAEMKRRIEDGSDISRAEMELAAGMGVDFSKDDPMSGVAF